MKRPFSATAYRNIRSLRSESLEARRLLAASVGWDGPGLGSADLTYTISNVPDSISRSDVESAIKTAFDAWANAVDLSFTEVDQVGLRDSIDITFKTLDGPGGTLAQAYFPDDVNNARIAGDIQFDLSESWEVGNSQGSRAFDLAWVATHEIGHALGLDHSSDGGSVLAAYVSPNQEFTGLDDHDIAEIRLLYAANDNPEPSGTDDQPTEMSTPNQPTDTQPTDTQPTDTAPTDTTGDETDDVDDDDDDDDTDLENQDPFRWWRWRWASFWLYWRSRFGAVAAVSHFDSFEPQPQASTSNVVATVLATSPDSTTAQPLEGNRSENEPVSGFGSHDDRDSADGLAASIVGDPLPTPTVDQGDDDKGSDPANDRNHDRHRLGRKHSWVVNTDQHFARLFTDGDDAPLV